ncbi:TcpE family conjugal transfer membrane protein [Actinomadura sp. WMMB 499]|uniref:TcpE family conjugal transfer membrane protein n=1 Tax=Actinomadura sp. WMMB 499 TaxID=1219491 RepID=UPI00124827F9|nr:TcpE family conjugal transfer membrane protein [Actinomadura sp. WMMB 499]QFG24849.1 hypothetical protein F7P10_30675 [Actinomadura sp. WMMB 499]
MDLPTYTNIWRIEKRLYKLYDLRLPMPLPLVQIGVFLGVFVPWIVMLQLVGLPFESPWHVLYIVPPGVLTWLATRPVIEGKRLTELLLSQSRYLSEPRTWCRLTPIREPREVVIVARVWRRPGAPAPAPERVAVKSRRRAAPAEAEVPAPRAEAPPVAPALENAPSPGKRGLVSGVRRPGAPGFATAVAPPPGGEPGDRRVAGPVPTRPDIPMVPGAPGPPEPLVGEAQPRNPGAPARPGDHERPRPPAPRQPAEPTPARPAAFGTAQPQDHRVAGPPAGAEPETPRAGHPERPAAFGTAQPGEPGRPAPQDPRVAGVPPDDVPIEHAPIQALGGRPVRGDSGSPPAGGPEGPAAFGPAQPGEAGRWEPAEETRQGRQAPVRSAEAPRAGGPERPAAFGAGAGESGRSSAQEEARPAASASAPAPARPAGEAPPAGRPERPAAFGAGQSQGTGPQDHRAVGAPAEEARPTEQAPAAQDGPGRPEPAEQGHPVAGEPAQAAGGEPEAPRAGHPERPAAFGAVQPGEAGRSAPQEPRVAGASPEETRPAEQVPVRSAEAPPAQQSERPAAFGTGAGESGRSSAQEEARPAASASAPAPARPAREAPRGGRPERPAAFGAGQAAPQDDRVAGTSAEETRPDGQAPVRPAEVPRAGAGQGWPSEPARPAAASGPARAPAPGHQVPGSSQGGQGWPQEEADGPRLEAPRPWSKGLSKPTRPAATDAQTWPPASEPETPQDQEPPPRDVRSGPQSPVRPRPLPPPPAPPPSGPAITPPGPEHEVSGGGLRRLFQAVGGGHGDVDAEYQLRLQQPFRGTRHVVVLGCTGGAGQTVTALMLGHTFAQHNAEPVVAIDVNPGPGALARRTRSETNETLTGLITRADQVGSLTAMRRYTSQAKSGLDVIAAGKNPLQALDDRDYALAIRTIDRFYSVTLLDTAAAVVARVLPYADQLVLVAPASADAPRAVAMTYEWLDGHGYEELRSRAVTVINGVSRRSMDDVEQAEAVARGRCRALVRIPWDDHLSMDRAPRNELKSLRAPTRRAYLALAGVVAGGFGVVPERYQELHQEQEATR